MFRAHLPGAAEVSDEPRRLAEAARAAPARRFLAARVAISGANFAVAETGTSAVVESEGNGRMCLTLPPVLDQGHGDREGRAHLAGPRGLPPAAAALLHRPSG